MLFTFKIYIWQGLGLENCFTIKLFTHCTELVHRAKDRRCNDTRMVNARKGVVVKLFFFILLLTILGNTAWSSAVTVFDVRKSLRLNESDPIYHDYYINAGSNQGLRRGLLVTVQRRIPFRDNSLSKVQEDLVVNVAILELIHVQNSFSIARLHRSLIGKASPVLEYDAVMVGDKADMGSVRRKAKGAKSAKKSTKTGRSVSSNPLPTKKISVEVKHEVAKVPAPEKAVEVPIMQQKEQPILSTSQGL